MGHMKGVHWLLGILLAICSDPTLAQTKRSSRTSSSRTFGINIKTPSSSGIDFDCPEEFGYYPHPSDCTQYYVCVFGGALLESCTGGLMYSHELQTCDWPRNVGCELAEVTSSVSQSSSRDTSSRIGQIKQQPQPQITSRVRFSSLTTAPGQQQIPKQSSHLQQPQTQQQHRQQQIIPAQIQAIPPPPELRIAPNPVITSRGQPKPLLDSREDIAKLYAEAHDTLPPAEEEETDRQQRVYRGQPSTVGQVQRDRDGIIHHANANALPNHGKVGSYAFGSQANQFRVETSSQAPANIFIQQRPKQVVEQNTRNYYNTSNQSYDPYDSYYSVYDDDVDLYRDVEYNQQQQRGKTQHQSTYRPEVITTPSPQVPVRETFVSKSHVSQIQQQDHQYKHQPSHTYSTDYEDALIAQIENDEEYNQQQRNPPIRGDRIEINSITERPIVISSTLRTSDQPKYTPATYAPMSHSTIQHQQQQQKSQQQSSSQKMSHSPPPPKPIPTRPTDQYSIVTTQPTVSPPIKQSPTRNNNRNRGGAHYTSNDREQPSTATANRGTHPPRSRPTLKPSGTIVSKAAEFVDIYKYPPSRAEPLYPQPTPDKTAAKCRKDVCLLPDCYCGGKEVPGDLPVESVPQIVLLTFDDSVNDLNKQLYTDLFEKGRVNPNGCPITATFYVSHEWTDYSQVQNLYAEGHEMASHTVSHSFGEQFSQKKWTREVAGQREILAAYGGVKLADVRGMRAPFLSIGGNKMFKMLYDSNFTYDSSMPVYENRPPSWPYTLDYKIFHDCMIPPCPTKSYPGVWEVPMVMWQDLNGGRCSMGDACSNPSDSENVFKMLMKNFERHYTTNRAPFGLFYHAAWFTQPHHKEGFINFLDTINAMSDVWIVTNWQALQWIRDPTPISRMNQFQPFQCDYSDRPKRCNNPKVCNLWHKSGVRYMRTCQPCPDIYPWTGKSGIRSSRVDNDIDE